MKTTLYVLIFILLQLQAFSKTAEEWKSRVIYEIMTDRFSKGNGDTTPCSNLGDYCGGTFKGIEQNLDYIQGAGFNALWISPVQPNSPRGYHGYAPIDFYGINQHFGTEQDFKDLMKACHERDIWVMVDIVANHIGFVQEDGKWEQTENNDYSSVIPFNKASYFHKYEIECHDAERRFPDDQVLLETCWLYYLPDLNQDVPFVRKTLLEWIHWLVKTYDIDGLRLDALRHVSKPFWKEFSEAAGVFTLGEAWVPSIPFNADYQKYVDSILNFPLYENIMDVFANEKPMTLFSKYFAEASVHWKDMTILANFVDCHDKARFLSLSGDLPAFKGSFAFVLSYLGVPIVYYGSEQAFNGGDDPANREPLWTSMNPDSEMYQFFKLINEFRKNSRFYEHDQIERFADDKLYAFSRGEYFFVFTNSIATETREISNHSYQDDTWLCNVFNNGDCVQVVNGKFTISISNKNSKILFPKPSEDSNKSKHDILRTIKEIVSSAIGQESSRLS